MSEGLLCNFEIISMTNMTLIYYTVHSTHNWWTISQGGALTLLFSD